MEVGKLSVEIREGKGKGVSKRLRLAGKVPGVVYGKGVEPLMVAVDPKALKKSLDPVKRQNTVIELSIAGGKSLTVMLKDYEFHKLRNEIEHVDLLAIDINKEVHVDVPLVLTGKPKGIVDGGQLTIAHRNLPVICKPANIPTKIEADITTLGLGEALHVSDLVLPAGVRVALGTHEGLASIVAPREEKVVAPTAEAAAAAAPAAGAAAPAAAGGDKKAAAPAAGGDKKAAPAAGGKEAKK
jgi:large subunit ribosomal protein L25